MTVDIIERLRADLDMLSSSQMHALGEDAAAEIERLRAILRDIERALAAFTVVENEP